MDRRAPSRDLEPLGETLAALASGVRAISGLPATAWTDVGPVEWGPPGRRQFLCCAFCGTPLTDFYRRGRAGQAVHCDRKECLTTMREVALFALETCIGSEPPGDRDALLF